MEYYSVIKKNEMLPFKATWMDLEGIMLSEISQTEKDKHYMTSLKCGILKQIYKPWTHSYRGQIVGYQRQRVESG